MSETSKSKNEYQDYSPHRWNVKRDHNYTLSHDKFVVPWQMTTDIQKMKSTESKDK